MRNRTKRGSTKRSASESESPNSPWNSSVRLLAWLATCVSVLSTLFYYQRGDVLLYGDAIAHINIARRVFDSKTPGLLQLGTVWLPLPHLLMIPFILSKDMWQRGIGGSIPSMAAYVLGVVGIYRLTSSALVRPLQSSSIPVRTQSRPDQLNLDQIDIPARVAAWTAAIVYAANPNLIYMQTTAMGESLYLAFFIWSVVFLVESRSNPKALTKSALCLAAACLTRYDGWFLAAAMCAVLVVLFILQTGSREPASGAGPTQSPRLSVTRVLTFVLISAFAPALWLAYNAIVYRNPLEFANGPYSAKAIEQKSQTAGNAGHPGSGNPILAERYFLKSAEDNLAPNEWLQRAWLLLAFFAIIGGAIHARFKKSSSDAPSAAQYLPLLFLLVPAPFYALSIAYSGVPIFIPNWWPFTHYNVRYGLQLLPAFSLALAFLIYLIVRTSWIDRRIRMAGVIAVFVLVVASYGSIWRATPICLEEARINMRTRNELQMELASWLPKLGSRSTILMYLGDQVGALERAGIPLNRTINEGNHRTWKQPSDPQGLWEHALADPGKYADYVVALEGDPVWQAMQGKHLPEMVEIHVTGQPRTVIYQARPSDSVIAPGQPR
jgi:hypothetical protein